MLELISMYLGCPILSHSKVISQHLLRVATKFFQYSRAFDLLLDHHTCQVAPKLQSRSHFVFLILDFKKL